MKYTIKKLLPGIFISIVVMISSFFFYLSTTNFFEYNESEMSVTNHYMEVTIEDDGDIYVKEDVTIDIETYYNYIIKDIGYSKDYRVEHDLGFEIDKASSSFDESSFIAYVYDENGLLIDYELERNYDLDQDKYVSYKMTSYRNFVSGVKIHYEYRINNAVTVYNDVAELNWILIDDVDYNTSNIEIDVILPTNTNVDSLLFYGHGVSKENALTQNGKDFKITIDKLVKDELIEVRILFNKEAVSNVNPNKIINQNALDKIVGIEESMQSNGNLESILLLVNLLTFAIIAIIGILKTIKCYKEFDKERTSLFDSQYYRELPADYSPAELGMLLNFNELSKHELEATLLDLIRRKYIELDLNGCSTLDSNPNYKLRLLDVSLNDLKPHEIKVLNWFFKEIGNGSTLTLNELDKYLKNERNARKYLQDSKEFGLKVANESKKHNFFDDVSVVKSQNSSMIFTCVIGCIVCFISFGLFNYNLSIIFMGLIISIAILFAFYVNNIKRRSEQGNEDYVRWMAFKNFLEDFSTFEDYPMPSIIVWEKYLVYASEFGIAKKVEEQMNLKFKKMDLNAQEYFDNPSSSYLRYRFSCYYFHHRISSTYTIANTTIANSSSSNGSKGGFGGGRSFGGGGGGMRGGR